MVKWYFNFKLKVYCLSFSVCLAYSSLKLLGNWTRDLILRVEHFANWALTTHPPLLFWLAAYTFPTGFLTAVLQASSA